MISAKKIQNTDLQCHAFAESGAANAVCRHDPTCENGIPERPQTLRYSEIINIFSLAYAQSASGGHSKSSCSKRETAFSGGKHSRYVKMISETVVKCIIIEPEKRVQV